MDLLRAAETRRDFVRRSAGIGGALLGSASLAALLDACGGSSSSSKTGSAGPESGLTLAQVQKASGTIKMYGWNFYEVDPAQNNGPVKAKWSPIASSLEIPTKIKPKGSFDVFNSSSLAMPSIFLTHRIIPLDTALIPNYKAILPSLRNNPAWFGPSGKIYAVPFAVTPSVTGYDASKVAEPRTMQDLLKPELKGWIGVLDDPINLLQFAHGLGIGDPTQPNHLTPAELKQVMTYLKTLRPQVKTVYTFGGETQLFSRGDIRVAFQTYGSLLTASSKNGANVKASLLGSISYVDALSILNDANFAATYNWVNHAISKHAQEEMASKALTNPVVGHAAGLPAPLDVPLATILKRSPVLGPVPPVTTPGYKYVTYEDLNNAWTQFKSSF